MTKDQSGNKTALLTIFLLVMLLVLMLFSLSLGRAGGPVLDLLPWDALGATGKALGKTEWIILMDIRLPRSFLAVITGITLGLSGAAMQGLFRNPLADPGIIGTSSTASLGAVIVLYFGLGGGHFLALPAGGITGALLGLIGLYILTGRHPTTTGFILAGVALGTLAVSLSSLALNLAPSPYASLEILFWMMGSVADRSFSQIWVALPFMGAGWVLILTSGRGIDALSLGEEGATSLGFNVSYLQARIVIGSALCVGASVSISGAIGFVGLTVPHLLRPLVGYQPKALLIPSALGGGVLVLMADLAVRAMPPGPELKLGVLTAIVGAPFFFWLLVRYRKEML